MGQVPPAGSRRCLGVADDGIPGQRDSASHWLRAASSSRPGPGWRTLRRARPSMRNSVEPGPPVKSSLRQRRANFGSRPLPSLRAITGYEPSRASSIVGRSSSNGTAEAPLFGSPQAAGQLGICDRRPAVTEVASARVVGGVRSRSASRCSKRVPAGVQAGVKVVQTRARSARRQSRSRMAPRSTASARESGGDPPW